jgi:hypothetical protein
MVATRLAHLRPLRRGGRCAARCRPVQAQGRLQPLGACLRSGWLRRFGPPAERGHHPDERQSRGAAGWRRARVRRRHRCALAPRRSPPAGVGRIRCFAGRRHRRHHGRLRQHGRRYSRGRRARLAVSAPVGEPHGGADPAAARPRSGRGHGRSVPRRSSGRTPDRRVHPGRRSACSRQPACPAGHSGPGDRRDAGAVHALRLRAEPSARRSGRRLCEHRACCWRRRRRRHL